MPNIEELVDRLSSAEQVVAYRARRELADLVAKAGAPDAGSTKDELAAALGKMHAAQNAEGNAPKFSPLVRSQIAQALSTLGGDMEVPDLRKALSEFDAREMARWALERMNCQAATDALVEAAQSAVGPEFRVGAIQALARRASSDVVEVLKRAAADLDLEVRLAAAEALAAHADATADAAICAAALGGSRRADLRVAKARIRLAETLAQAGQKDRARSIYEAVAAGPTEEPQKQAAREALRQLA